MLRLPILLLAMLFIGALNAQRGEEGSGNLVTQDRDLRDFDEIAVSHAIAAAITQGNRFSVVIEADDNIINQVETKIRGGKLSISLPDGFNFVRNVTIRATITMPELNGVQASGATRLTAIGFNQTGASLDLMVSGASRVIFENSSYQNLDLKVSGASHIDLEDLAAKTANLAASGASKIKLNVSDRIGGSASGASNVTYTGRPAGNVRTSGASSVRGN